MKKIKHYLASANTGERFINQFNSILDSERLGYTFVLKGGPGTGKSTLMKKIGEHFTEKNYEVEYFHCSSDFNSLDGVRIVELNICVLDGTAPHTFDISFPQVDGEIVNLGEFVSPNINKHAEEIFNLKKLKQNEFNSVYSNLIIAKEIENQKKFEIENSNAISNKVSELIKQLNLKKQSTNFKERKLFLEYVGLSQIENISSLNEYKQVITLNENSLNAEKILSQLKSKFFELGYSIITFDDILTNKLSAIYLEKNDILIIKQNAVSQLDLTNLVQSNELQDNQNADKHFTFNEKLDIEKNIAISKIASSLSRARDYHKEIESYFVDNLNKTKLDKITKTLINSIKKKKLSTK